MREDPFDAAHDRGDAAASGAAEHADVDDVGLRSDADVLAGGPCAVPRDDPRNVRPMSAGIAREALVGEVHGREEPVGGLDEVRIGGDSRVEHRDRHALAGRPLLPDRVGVHGARVGR